jgi:FkbM family methyltransferase
VEIFEMIFFDKERFMTAVEPWMAYLGRKRGFRRGTKIFEDLRKRRSKYYQGRIDSWATIDDYDGDLKMRVDRSVYIGGLIYWHGGRSTSFELLLRRILNPDMVMIDIGANQGETTLLAAKRLPQGQVIAFEPLPTLFEQLQTNIKLNDFQNVTAFQYALADSPGLLPMFTSIDLEIHSSFNEGLASLFQSDYRDTMVDQVTVDTLDNIAEHVGLNKVDVIKIDVEGAEERVLAGGINVLKRYQPKLLMEINPTALAAAGSSPLRLVNLLSPLGYKFNIVAHGNYYPIASADELGDCDVYCEA